MQNIIQGRGHVLYSNESETHLPLSERKIYYRDFIQLLRTLTPPPKVSRAYLSSLWIYNKQDSSLVTKRHFIYQPSIVVPPCFYERYGIPRSTVTFSQCFPDFLEVTFDASERLVLTIIDAKASPEVKFSHRIQVAMYTLLLEEVFRHEAIHSRVTISNTGGVWLRYR